MGYYFTSTSKQKKIHETISSKSNFIVIVSSGGMGGSSLLEYSHQYLNNNGFKTIKTNGEQLRSSLLKSHSININENDCSCLACTESKANECSVILIDGFDAFFNDRVPFNFELAENWIKAHLKLGSRFIMKVNSIDDKFKSLLNNWSYEIITLNKMHTSIKKRIFNDVANHLGLDFDDDLKETILSLKFSSYRVFENFLVYIFISMNLKKIKLSIKKIILSKLDVYFLHNRFCK